MGPLQLGSRDHNFPKIFYIMGYNLKNARNGKSISKIPKWQSLRSLALKSKFVCQLEFLENLEYIYGNKSCKSSNISKTTATRVSMG